MRLATPREEADPVAAAWARRFRGLAHPLRLAILEAVRVRPLAVAELAADVDRPPQLVNHHVRTLVAAGCLEVAGERRRAGGVQRLYALARGRWLDEADALRLARSARDPDQGAALAALYEDTSRAVRAGLLSGAGEYLSRHPMLLDEQGERELEELIERLVARVRATVADAGARVARDPGDPGTPIRVAVVARRGA